MIMQRQVAYDRWQLTQLTMFVTFCPQSIFLARIPDIFDHDNEVHKSGTCTSLSWSKISGSPEKLLQAGPHTMHALAL